MFITSPAGVLTYKEALEAARMNTVNGSPVYHYSSTVVNIKDTLHVGFPKLIKPTVGIPIKGLHIANMHRNPDYPADKGRRQNLVIQTPVFERAAFFENPGKVSLLFKLSDDESSLKFAKMMDDLDNTAMKAIASDRINFPTELGPVSERYRPVIKDDSYRGRVQFQVRGEMQMQDGKPKDTLLGEMTDDGPKFVTYDYFKDNCAYRPIVAIIEFPYMVVMNTGTKSISIKPLVKQLLLMPPVAEQDKVVADNSTFKFDTFM